MKPRLRFGALALALGLCAPAYPALAQTAPAPQAAEAAAAPGLPPENWWLLDADADRIPGIGAERAYRELLAGREPKRSVVVAIIDSGVDVGHEDLAGNLWVNEKEIPGNGADDDGNGYVDDVHGWNFIGGRDGGHVGPDTYEVTRLYARLRAVCEGADGRGRAECDRYPEIRSDFQAKRAEAARMLQQVRQIDVAVDRFVSLLKQHLGTDSLTVEQVTAMRVLRPELVQARGVYLQLAAAGITPEQVKKERKMLEGQVEHGYNPDFDPRSIVGDRYDDPADRFYGNPDVAGPSADHGTHVAGIAGARRGNGIGMDGVAPSPRIMVLRAVPDGDERDKDVANAIRYAVDNGAHVINMSFGKAYSPEKRLVDEAVRYAESKGVLLVHAAGNDGADLNGAGNFPNRHYEDGGEAGLWIEVGASAWQADSLAASFSNYGRGKVDVFAPGSSIYSTVPGNGYERNQGTSMAAPVVTGVAALLMAYYPELTAAEVRQIILDSATRYTDRQVARPGSEGERARFGDLSTTGGVVNAYEAVRMAEEVVARKRTQS